MRKWWYAGVGFPHSLGEMRRDELQPNVITYSALISACGKGCRPEWAWQLFDGVRQDGLLTNVVTYGTRFSTG